jgi:uncharacterized protein (DUF1800 family)
MDASRRLDSRLHQTGVKMKHIRNKAVALAAATALAACTDDELGAPTDDQAARFMGQSAFGADQASIDAVKAQGYGGWLDAQFAMPLSASLWDWLVAKGFGDAKYKSSDQGMDNALWWRLFTSPDVLRQRVVLALSQMFVVSIRNIPFPWGNFGCVAYWELLEAECFGNFRTLLERVTLSPVMGVYLNMRGNRKEDASGRVPDENYAREVLQLFTIGLTQLDISGQPKLDAKGQPLDTYDNTTVTGLAKVLTGWDFDGYDGARPDYMRRPMVFSAMAHSTLDKTFLGVTVPGNTPGQQALKTALDTIFNHPNVGPFIGRQLIQHLVTSNPSTDYVARVAMAFNNNGQGVRGDMKAVIRAVLMDMEARSDLFSTGVETFGKLREPVVRVVQWARLAKVSSTDGLWNAGDLSASNRIGQSPLRSPSVFNFFRPGYVPPNTDVAQRGLVAPEFQITDESSVIGYANFLMGVLPTGSSNVVPDYSSWLPWAKDPAALVARLNLWMTGNVISAATVNRLVTALGTINASNDDGLRRRVVTAMLIVLCCPDYLVQR